jgi:Fe-S-cluster containining protein
MQRRIASDGEACGHCLSGSCCSTEDPIGLTALDVLRLSAFLDLSPGAFLERFTQDRFEEDGNPEHRASMLEDPDSSVVTWLRRRANSTFSPCIFLKFVREPDETPRRICSVHPARPLACREYYHDTCKTRWTGEIATIHAHGYEQIRDGWITPALARTQLNLVSQRLRENPFSAPDLLARSFWTEMDRALHAEACNHEGAAYDVREWQHPLPLKLNRLLSRRNLRLEERYGSMPWGDQLQPYAAGSGLAGSAERERLLHIAGSAAQTHFFARAEYPLHMAHRDWMPHASPAPGFPVLSERALRRLISGIPADRIWPAHRIPAVSGTTRVDVALGIVRGVNFLARFSAYLEAMEGVLELAPAGQLEAWLLAGCRVMSRCSSLPARHPAFARIMDWSAPRAGRGAVLRDALRRLRSIGPPRPPAAWRWIRTQEADGGWGTRPSGEGGAQVQGEYLQQILWRSLCGVNQLTKCEG